MAPILAIIHFHEPFVLDAKANNNTLIVMLIQDGKCVFFEY